MSALDGGLIVSILKQFLSVDIIVTLHVVPYYLFLTFFRIIFFINFSEIIFKIFLDIIFPHLGKSSKNKKSVTNVTRASDRHLSHFY